LITKAVDTHSECVIGIAFPDGYNGYENAPHYVYAYIDSLASFRSVNNTHSRLSHIIIIIIIIIITKVVPVIIGATGIISDSFGKYVSNIPGKHEVMNYRKQPYWALHTYCGKY